MLEILAPAGNIDCANAAIENGANAIYVGFSAFSARASATNFNLDELSALIKRARLLSVRVYVAMNTMIKNSELTDFIKRVFDVWEVGADAIILQDMFIGARIHKMYPEITLHLSTQAGICNLSGAIMAKKHGFSRVILARETPLEDIRKIAEVIETEVFVQGALCTCYSGQCYFSSFVGGNSGNRGRCKQPCRKLYSYDRKGYEEKAYALSLSDLSVGKQIERLKEAGATSFKIEGRMRRPEYVAAATRYYRLLLDMPDGEEKERALHSALSDLKRTYNRGNYTSGLAFGQDKKFLSRDVQGHIGEKVGTVKVQNGKYYVESAFAPVNGDAFKILRSGKEVGGATFVKRSLRGFEISSKNRLLNGDGVFVTTDNQVTERLLSTKKTRPISLRLNFTVGEYAVAECDNVRVLSNEVLTPATGRPLAEDEIKACFLKTDGSPFSVTFDEIRINGDVFMAKSQLNAFRRKFYAALENSIAGVDRKQPYRWCVYGAISGDNGKIAVMAESFDCITDIDVAILKPRDYTLPLPESFLNGNFEKFLYYPAFTTGRDEARIDELVKSGVDGIYADNYGGIRFARERGLKIFVGTGINVSNHADVSTLYEDKDVAYYAVSKELDDVSGLTTSKAFALSSGGLKLMDLCYCPFEKTCSKCDKRTVYALTDENGRVFPVRRYVSGDGSCRFEVYNCVNLLDVERGFGQLFDWTVEKDIQGALSCMNNKNKQKEFYGKYTLGHTKSNPLL